MLVLVVLATGALVRAHEDMNEKVRGSLEIENGLWQLLSALQDAETGQRGYLLTGDPQYLDAYNNGAPHIPERLEYLRRATAGNAAHQQALDALAGVMERRLVIIDNGIALYAAGRIDEATSIIGSDEGKRLMDRARSIVAVMRSGEDQYLDALKDNTRRAVRRLEMAIVAAIVAVILLAAYAVFDAYRRSAGLVRTRNELRVVNSQLVQEAKTRAAVEEQLRQSQKMEAMGQLTGGLAHDFNNMLAVIVGNLNLLSRRLARGETDVERYIAQAMDGTERATTLTHRLLAFARKQPLSPEPIEINRLVASMSDMLNRTLGETIRVETVLAGGLWTVNVDPGQLENAILNLSVNARDAMSGGGRLTIETANAHLDDMYAANHVGVPAGQYVLVAVSDTGTGMPEEVVAKAFEPFFTTKEAGKGTGLGLSQVHGFVYQSGGHVKIYSEPGSGSSVKIYLPRHHGAATTAQPDADMAPPPQGAPHQVILVVEDDDRVRQMSVDALRDLGYTVIHANGAEAALRLLDEHPEVTLLFTDIVMPDVNGRELADRALERRPGLKVLFTTGYTRNAVVHNGVVDPGVQLIGKPFTLYQLAHKVHEAIHAGPD
ncbi:CHASE3 domain-containing protein [Emcibacter sp. SYSU 3D8]|uniref:CHASE3 domain-containing protein n=1 Tax=Emcibacter sp. SYSU 3D8 TaxID=3133969 RepID=UPI0031FEC488